VPYDISMQHKRKENLVKAKVKVEIKGIWKSTLIFPRTASLGERVTSASLEQLLGIA